MFLDAARCGVAKLVTASAGAGGGRSCDDTLGRRASKRRGLGITVAPPAGSVTPSATPQEIPWKCFL